jgi:hypothetical protein
LLAKRTFCAMILLFDTCFASYNFFCILTRLLLMNVLH